MNCQKCHIRLATIKITQVINGNRTDFLLCPDCAQGMGLDGLIHEENEELSELISQSIREAQEEIEQMADIECSNCHLNFKEFFGSGLLGCPQCYDDFDEYIKPLIRRYHGTTSHQKTKELVYNTDDIKYQLIILKKELAQALQSEDFESAAKLRDKIKSIEKKK